jgi:Flp pilus assembly protein CpaB
VSRHRSLLAAGLAAGSVAAAMGTLVPHPPAGVRVVTAGHDLAAGAALAARDLRVVELPTQVVPDGVAGRIADVVGRVLAAPLRSGETITDVRLAGAELLPVGVAGLVAVPVRVADAASAALVTAGDHVDVLAAGTTPGAPPTAVVVAVDTEVLAVPSAVGDEGAGALLVVAASPPVAARLAAAAVSSRLSLTLRARPVR